MLLCDLIVFGQVYYDIPTLDSRNHNHSLGFFLKNLISTVQILFFVVVISFILIFSPTKTSRLEMLGNVKNQMTNWIGGGIASLRKTSEGDASAVAEQAPDSPLLENSPKDSIKEKDDDDNSRCVYNSSLYLLVLVNRCSNLCLHF